MLEKKKIKYIWAVIALPYRGCAFWVLILALVHVWTTKRGIPASGWSLTGLLAVIFTYMLQNLSSSWSCIWLVSGHYWCSHRSSSVQYFHLLSGCKVKWILSMFINNTKLWGAVDSRRTRGLAEWSRYIGH